MRQIHVDFRHRDGLQGGLARGGRLGLAGVVLRLNRPVARILPRQV